MVEGPGTGLIHPLIVPDFISGKLSMASGTLRHIPDVDLTSAPPYRNQQVASALALTAERQRPPEGDLCSNIEIPLW